MTTRHHFRLHQSSHHAFHHPLLCERQIELWIYYPAQSHAHISGNKQAKLKHALLAAKTDSALGIATFGGAFSNHLLACAAACSQLGMASLGWVRSHQLDLNNPCLRDCQALGMRLQALTAKDYVMRQQPEWVDQLSRAWPGYHWLPEGGSSALGVKGVAELNMAQTPNGSADLLITATGSGGTLAGLAQGNPGQRVLGLAVVKDESLPARVQALCPQANNWQLSFDHVGKGYGRLEPEIWQFCLHMAEHHGVRLEPIYTGKAFYGLWQRLASGEIKAGSRLVFLHSGGLQGLRGLLYRGLISNEDYQKLGPHQELDSQTMNEG